MGHNSGVNVEPDHTKLGASYWRAQSVIGKLDSQPKVDHKQCLRQLHNRSRIFEVQLAVSIEARTSVSTKPSGTNSTKRTKKRKPHLPFPAARSLAQASRDSESSCPSRGLVRRLQRGGGADPERAREPLSLDRPPRFRRPGRRHCHYPVSSFFCCPSRDGCMSAWVKEVLR